MAVRSAAALSAPPYGLRLHRPHARFGTQRDGRVLLAVGLDGLVVGLLSVMLLCLVVRLPAVLASLFPDHLAPRVFPVLLAPTLLVLVRGALMRTWYWTVRRRLDATTPAHVIRTTLLVSHSIAFVLLMAIVAALVAAGGAAAVDLVLTA